MAEFKDTGTRLYWPRQLGSFPMRLVTKEPK